MADHLFFKNRNGKDLFLIGTNYWPSASAINMWVEWHPEELTDDVIGMRRLGMNCCRPFLFLPDFLKEDGSVDAVMLERLKYFLNICEIHDLSTFPTFIVGHMSGEDWDLPWFKGPELINDRHLIELTKSYLTAVVQSVKDSSCILGWLLSNELPNFVGNQDPVKVAAWVNEMITAIREIDPKRPISVGDGAWSPEIIGKQTGFHLRKLNPYQDFVGLHFYPRGMSPWHHAYTTSFRTQMAKVWGKPVIVEEFGTSTTLCSEENQANYYRTVFCSALINGAHGALSWCLNDFDLVNRRPYSHHLFEERFGIVRSNKTLKPAAGEFDKFQKICAGIMSGSYTRIDHEIGLFIPSNYYYQYPYEFDAEVDCIYDFYLECFSLLKRANLDVCMVVEPAQELEKGGQLSHDLKLEQVPVLFMPRMKFMTKMTRMALGNYINDGGVVYFSFANDSWVTDWDKLAGVTTDCKFGIPDFRDTAQLDITVNDDWGEFRKDERFSLALLNDRPGNSYCPILSATAKVIMTDQYGMPFLLENQVGKGKVYFTPYPVEILLSKTNDDWIKRIIGRIYRSIVSLNRELSDVTIEGDGLESGIWESEREMRIVIVNHSWNEQIGQVRLKRKPVAIESSVKIIQEHECSYRLTLPRKEIAILSIKK